MGECTQNMQNLVNGYQDLGVGEAALVNHTTHCYREMQEAEAVSIPTFHP